MRAFVMAMVILGSSRSFADPAAEALVHLDRGIAAYRAQEFAVAERELVAAQQLAPDRPNPYRWLALDQVELGECKQALVNIESFLSRVAAGDPRVVEIVRLRERCVLELAAAKPVFVVKPVTKPINHEWWLWTAIGVVVAGAGLTTYLLVRDHTNELPAIACTQQSCAP